ncbi:hypothetical protein VCHC17A1_3367A, partial [Vibrio cholerae HC-17A1]|jgi:hypothetical protein
MLIS